MGGVLLQCVPAGFRSGMHADMGGALAGWAAHLPGGAIPSGARAGLDDEVPLKRERPIAAAPVSSASRVIVPRGECCADYSNGGRIQFTAPEMREYGDEFGPACAKTSHVTLFAKQDSEDDFNAHTRASHPDTPRRS